MRNAIAICSLFLLAGCPGGTTSDTPLTVAGFQQQTLDAECDLLVRCGNIAASDRPACMAALTAAAARDGRTYSPDSAISAGRLTLDQAAGHRCLDAVRGIGCGGDDIGAALKDCRAAAVGLVAAGGACQDDGECAAGYCDGLLHSGCMGTCKAFAAVTQSCMTARCAADAYCDTTTFLCQASVGIGGSCKSTSECQDALTCAAGKCTSLAALKAGDPCPTAFTSYCSPSLYCDHSKMMGTGVCTARVGQGAACTTPQACNDGLACAGITETMTGLAPGKCQPFLDTGAACDPTSQFAGCAWDAVCDATSKTCRTTSPFIGTPCAADKDCSTVITADGICDAATKKCVLKPGLGDACDPAMNQCTTGLACDATTKKCSLTCK